MMHLFPFQTLLLRVWGSVGSGGVSEGLPSFPRAPAQPSLIPPFTGEGISPNAPSLGLTVPRASHPLCLPACVLGMLHIQPPNGPVAPTDCLAHSRFSTTIWGMDTLPGLPDLPLPDSVVHAPLSSRRGFLGLLSPCSSPLAGLDPGPTARHSFSLCFCTRLLHPPCSSQRRVPSSPAPVPLGIPSHSPLLSSE